MTAVPTARTESIMLSSSRFMVVPALIKIYDRVSAYVNILLNRTADRNSAGGVYRRPY